MEEIEAKFLDIQKDDFEQKIISLGAIKIGDYSYKRKLYDFEDGRLSRENMLVRLRDEGSQVVLTYKKRFGQEKDALREGGTIEVETVVSDFDAMETILLALGLKEQIYKENKRTRYMLNGVEIDIDSWPLIPTYVELEGPSWELVESVARVIGFDWTTHVRGSNLQIYKVYGIDEGSYSVLTFDRQIKK